MNQDIELDIVIPVYNEGPNIRRVLDSFAAIKRTRFRGRLREWSSRSSVQINTLARDRKLRAHISPVDH